MKFSSKGPSLSYKNIGSEKLVFKGKAGTKPRVWMESNTVNYI